MPAQHPAERLFSWRSDSRWLPPTIGEPSSSNWKRRPSDWGFPSGFAPKCTMPPRPFPNSGNHLKESWSTHLVQAWAPCAVTRSFATASRKRTSAGSDASAENSRELPIAGRSRRASGLFGLQQRSRRRPRRHRDVLSLASRIHRGNFGGCGPATSASGFSANASRTRRAGWVFRRSPSQALLNVLLLGRRGLEGIQDSLGSAVEVLSLSNQNPDRPGKIALREGLGHQGAF